MISLPLLPKLPADKACSETLVQHCLTAQGQAVAPYEAEIDDIVARLCSLTDAELQIIRGES